MEPPVVQRVRELLRQRAPEFENGGPHTATFTIFNTYSGCFLRIGDRWAIITHRSRPAGGEADDDPVLFNAIGVTRASPNYPGGFVHGNCRQLAVALTGLGFLSQPECDEFEAWSDREGARLSLERAQARVRTLNEK